MGKPKQQGAGVNAGAPAVPRSGIALVTKAELELELTGLNLQKQQAQAGVQAANDRFQAVCGAIQLIQALIEKAGAPK